LLLTVNVGAFVPLNVTLVAPLKFVPVIWTAVPTGPVVGVNEVIVGRRKVTSKLDGLIPVPSESVTAILPSLAPKGTVAVMRTSELIVNVAANAVERHTEHIAPVLKPGPVDLDRRPDRAARRVLFERGDRRLPPPRLPAFRGLGA
jgi:hypothetical protein